MYYLLRLSINLNLSTHCIYGLFEAGNEILNIIWTNLLLQNVKLLINKNTY